MSELTKVNQSKANSRWQLLATASAVTLLGAAYTSNEAEAEGTSDHPTVWVELGGQLSRLDDGQEAFLPSFPVSSPGIFSSPEKFERMPRNGFEETGKLSFEPQGSDWVFSASVRYGRSTAKRDALQQTHPKTFIVQGITPSGQHYNAKYQPPVAKRFLETDVRNGESHTVLDFQAGKDVGLGLFGSHHGSSVLNVGVRFAQFTSQSSIALKSDPDWQFNYKYIAGKKFVISQPYHTNRANLQALRSFHGIGPSLSWNASVPIANTGQDSQLALDWGVNGAVLFGRQRAKIHNDAIAQYHPGGYGNAGYRIVTYNPTPVNVTRSRSVTVPNVGGFTGLSFLYANAKISAGYRADFFFGAMDGGINARKTYARGFYGPFATISMGLGR